MQSLCMRNKRGYFCPGQTVKESRDEFLGDPQEVTDEFLVPDGYLEDPLNVCSRRKMVATRPYIAYDEGPRNEFLNIKQTKQDRKIVSVEGMQ